MKSRITIEVDFENGNKPVIQVLQRKSEDVRDNLLQSFLQSLHGSCWCTINWVQDHDNPLNPEERFSRIFIRPLTKEMYQEHSLLMARAFQESDVSLVK